MQKEDSIYLYDLQLVEISNPLSSWFKKNIQIKIISTSG